MIQKAHEISLEAGSKMATAMKDVIFAAAGLTPFALESAKDLINYMVRRGQMGAEEAERIIRDVEAVGDKRGTVRPAPRAVVIEEPAPSFVPTYASSMPGAMRPPVSQPPRVAMKPPSKPAAKAAAPKPAAKPKVAAKKPAAKKPAAKAKKK